ncbi:hypothetical protein ARMGADRAFT_891863, partial [Armillaria gallica]
FIIVNCNGVHSMQVCSCYYQGDPNQVCQLMLMGLFPATLDQPKIAFTFQVLKQFQIACLQGKISAYNFINSLTRLT